jgi:hypothetical protein
LNAPVFGMRKRLRWPWIASPRRSPLTQSAAIALESLWNEQAKRDARFKDYACAQMLSKAHGRNDNKLTHGEFRAGLTMNSILIYPDGEFTVYISCGALFGAHDIELSGTVGDGPTSAQIA